MRRVLILFLPRALFVAVRLQALPALVLVHLEAAFLLEISHMELVNDRAIPPLGCRVQSCPRRPRPGQAGGGTPAQSPATVE